MNLVEEKALLSICIRAAFSDGAQSELERARIQKICEGFANDGIDLAAAYQEALVGTTPLPELVKQLTTPGTLLLAYEMAVCVCNVDGQLTPGEREFLAGLRQALGLAGQEAGAQAKAHDASADALGAGAVPPGAGSTSASGSAATGGDSLGGGGGHTIVSPERDAELDRMILNASILNGALELMPHSLATMAIVPLQMRMVYRIGKAYGFELGQGHIKDFLATVGVGLTSQVVEGFARRLFGSLARPLAGRFVGGVVGQAAGSAVSFATTYALGKVAIKYYASGRTLTGAQLKEIFESLLAEARLVQREHGPDISRKAGEVKLSELVPLVRQS